MRGALVAGLAASAVAACGGDGGAARDGAGAPSGSDIAEQVPQGTSVSGVWLVVGDDVPSGAKARIATLLARALGKPLTTARAEEIPALLDASSLVVSIGSTPLAAELVPDQERTALGPEAYVVRKGAHAGGMLVVAHGNPKAERPHGNLGAVHGAYALLEELRFAFLHPLAPIAPPKLVVPDAIRIASSPRWQKRTIHVHSQHPTELTDMLQGFGPGGPGDAVGFEASLDEWDRFLEWCAANGENGVEWFLLWASSWQDFADSPERVQRLGRLVEHAHAFGLDAGIDAPVAFAQQHSYRLLRAQGDLAAELSQIRSRLDWLMTAKLDFLGIEMGTSEFTHPTPDRMLAWMNEVAKHLDEKHGGVRAWVKVHCSTGQVADGYPDPKTGQPINFNMLPHFADKRLGVLPHTVQHYGLSDPAPTYGNANFGYIRDFTRSEIGKRPVMFYPESAYWVSFDVDVPLFLPIYAERRVSDLRMLASDEIAAGDHRMDGQLVFSSGWEWGYWLNDVVAARAAWDPHLDARSQDDAFAASLSPVARAFGSAGTDFVRWLGEVARAERELLIEGRVDGRAPSDVELRNGQAYLQGWETWDDVSNLASKLPAKSAQMTQPNKLGLVEMRNPLHAGPGYSAEVEPLLAAMERTFASLAARADALRARIPSNARDLFDDLADAAKMTALRAAQVHGLYDYVDGYWDSARARRIARLDVARKALDDAQRIATTREQRYRVPADRIASWRNGPTAYEFGYLWSVRSLYYWWRDEGKAIDAPVMPCYLNVINPIDVAFGEGVGTDAARLFGSLLSSDESRGCLAEPSAEPLFPQNGLRMRP